MMMNPQFWKLWIASGISNLGDGVIYTAAPLLAASLTRDPAQVAGLSVASRLPWFLFSLPAGGLVDRLDRRQVMVAMDVFRSALMLFLGLVMWMNWTNLIVLYIVFFLLGIAEVMFDTASRTILPAIVPKAQLETANSRLFLATSGGNEFAGPPLGGFLFALAAALPFLFHAGALAFAAALIYTLQGRFRVQYSDSDKATRTNLGNEIAEGLRWLLKHRLLRTLGIQGGIMNLVGAGIDSIMVLYALEILGLNEVGYGLLWACGSAGLLVAILGADRIIKRFGPGLTLFGTVLLMASRPAVMVLIPDFYVVGFMFILGGFASVTYNIITVSLCQAIVPDQILGRVNSVSGFIDLGAMPLGALLGGFLARVFGLSTPFWLTAVVTVGMAFVVLPYVNNSTIAEAKREV